MADTRSFYEVRARHHGTLTVTSRFNVGHDASVAFAETERDPTADRVELVAINETVMLSRGEGEPIDGWSALQLPQVGK